MATYKWDSPAEWLDKKIQKLSDSGDVTGLCQILRDILPNIDNDIIQNIYQEEMDEDGYFEDLDKKDVFRDRLHQWIENETNFFHLSSQPYDGPKMTHEDFLRLQYSATVDDLYRDHGGDIEEAISYLSEDM